MTKNRETRGRTVRVGRSARVSTQQAPLSPEQHEPLTEPTARRSKRSSEAGRLNSFDVIFSSIMLLSRQTIIVGRSTEAFGELAALFFAKTNS